MVTLNQAFYRKSLADIEAALNAKACSEAMMYYYELQRKFILKCLLRWQIKEFDRGSRYN